MRWFRKQDTPPAVVQVVEGFSRGQVVWHKADGKRMVIVGFYPKPDELGPFAQVAFSSSPNDVMECYLSELVASEPAHRKNGDM